MGETIYTDRNQVHKNQQWQLSPHNPIFCILFKLNTLDKKMFIKMIGVEKLRNNNLHDYVCDDILHSIFDIFHLDSCNYTSILPLHLE
jgi:uncharacterized protein YlaI